MTRRLLSLRALAIVAVLAGGLALALWLIPSGHYLLLPDRAQPVEPLVDIANEDEGDAGEGGIYMVDILVRKANLLERVFPGINDGADLIDSDRLNPEGVSEQQRRKSNQLDMTRSQEIAAAVALEVLGYEVDIQASGAEISLVVPDSPAASAGLEPGDVIVGAQGQEIATTNDLRTALAPVTPGELVAITVQRDGGLTDYELGTIEADQDPGRAVIGVLVQQSATIDLPVEITIDAGSIGGPSAGLAFALDIVDELGNDVDQGRRIVVTGALTLEGTVEPIGGIKQKVIGAREADADIFVVPLGNAKEAQRYAGDDLAIVPVATFQEALDDLAWRSGGPPSLQAAGTNSS